MADALRAARLVPAFLAAPRRSISSRRAPCCGERQARDAGAERRAGRMARRRWRTCRTGPPIVVANEFFDALPVRQFVRDGRRLARAAGRARRGGRARLRPCAGADAGLRMPAAARRRAGSCAARRAGDARRSPRASSRRAARCWPSTTATPARLRRHAAGREAPRLRRRAGRARRGGPHRPCRFRRAGAPRPRAGSDGWCTARRRRARSWPRSASPRAPTL